MQKKLILHASLEMCTHIESGKHKFSRILCEIFEGIGFEVRAVENNDFNQWKAKFDRNYHIHHLGGAEGPRALNMRKTYFDPFWSIDKSNTRYWGRIAHKAFIPGTVGPGLARSFFNNMQRKFVSLDGQFEKVADYVLLPLQGKLCKQRSWQYADLVTMVSTIRTFDPGRQIVLKPHPKENYGPKEMDLLRQLAQFAEVSLSEAPIQSLLASCAYVVTHNSSVAFEGILFCKPAILFARSDYHHIFPAVKTPGDAAKAFAQIWAERIDYEKYIYWFLQMNCVNVSRPEAADKIREMLYEGGWVVRT